jgi:hypothetical protein
MLILTAMFAFKNNHYLTRTSKRKQSTKPTLNFKVLWNNLKDKLIPKKPNVPLESPTTPEISLVSDDLPEVNPTPTKKRKYVRKAKNTVKNDPPEIEENEPDEKVQPIENENGESGKRRVVDNQLTPDIADHISKTLGNKKKPERKPNKNYATRSH